MIIETARLHLRRWQDRDWEPFAEMNADKRVMEFFPACLNQEESKNFIQRAEEKIEKNGFGLLAVETREHNEFIGYIGLNIPDFIAPFTPCVEIGWRLSAHHWGKGYATEGAKAILRYAFTQAKLNEVLSWTYEGNYRSRKVMEKIGMRHDSKENFDHPNLADGHWLRRHVLYRIANPDTME